MVHESPATVSYTTELVRKSIHFCSIVIPIFYFFTPRSTALAILLPLALIFILIDVARHNHAGVESWFYRTFGWLLRRRESDRANKRLNGATYVFISAALCVLLFPKLVAIVSFMILIISDTAGSLVGRKFGRHKFLGKSLEGSGAFFLTALLVVALTPKVGYYAGEYAVSAVAALAGTLVEALPWDVDDNLSVPLTVGAAMWGAYALFLPTLDLYKFG